MHVSLTRVSTADQPIENATIVAEEMTRWLDDIEGFQGFLMLSRQGTTLGLTFWESRAAAERNRATRLEFLDRITSVAGVEVEEIVDYEVAFARLAGIAVDGA
ncbi:MAG TPA: hypothetical protein VLN26_17905 [Gaiellaceae bacterium]|nr:hypothetical protein [Gaiellaceae bacterium]